MAERDVWFRFVKENGEPYKRSTYDVVKSSSDQKIIDLRDKVHAEHSDYLKGIHRSELTVWEEGATNALDEFRDIVGNRGTTKANALVVVVPAVNLNVRYLTRDGLKLPYLTRNGLMERIYDALDIRTRFILFETPSGYGKTSLLTLFAHRYRRINCIPVSFLDVRSALDLLVTIGIDLVGRQTTLNNNEDQSYVVMIDDAQAKYGDESFWDFLIKSTSWLPSNIQFIISATHTLKGDIESPIEFDSINVKFFRKDFLMDDVEAGQFLQLDGIGLPFNMRKPNFMQLLIRECNGLIGALRISVDAIATHFKKNSDPDEDALTTYFLSQEFLYEISQCFGGHHMTITSPELKSFLVKVLTEGPNFHSDDLDSLVSPLEKAGILVRSQEESIVKFLSPLAEKYYSNWLFPDRAFVDPQCLHDLIKQAIANMSASLFMNSLVFGNVFPNDAILRCQFITGLKVNTRPTCSIWQELGRAFPESASGLSERVDGKTDIYLKQLGWGIALLTNGQAMPERMDQFQFTENMKYVPLGAKDHVVVDLRCGDCGEMTNVSRHPKRITVFLKWNDWSTCECIFGDSNSLVHITLMN